MVGTDGSERHCERKGHKIGEKQRYPFINVGMRLHSKKPSCRITGVFPSS